MIKEANERIDQDSGKWWNKSIFWSLKINKPFIKNSWEYFY